jgi:hypothetical protein
MLYTLVVKENERPRQHDEDAVPSYNIENRVWVILTRAWDPDPRQRPTAAQLVDITAPLVSDNPRPAKPLPPSPAKSVPPSVVEPAPAHHEATETKPLQTWMELASSPDVTRQIQMCESLTERLQDDPTIRLLTEALDQVIRFLGYVCSIILKFAIHSFAA